MDPFSLIALATAAGFVFRKMSGSNDNKREKTGFILPRRSKISPGQLSVKGSGIDIDEIEELPEYLFIKRLIDSGFPIVFVTGGAGTGKSTFINWLMHHYQGNVLLAAPTAIAASNIDGKTLHSLFQLPLQWISQKGIKSAPYRKDIKNARLLVIDEISMVNANLLDGVSAFLRKNRDINKPFGGLPVVMVGDLFQLPPVIKQGLLGFYEKHYGGQTKFYAARSLTESSLAYYAVELSKTFRQSDALFVDVLADIREGTNLKEALEVINSSCMISQAPPAGAVWLAPRRQEVDKANTTALQKLKGRAIRFDGLVEGDFQTATDSLPSPLSLLLKEGAQVMFTRNDPSGRWVNGSIGTVTSLSDGIIVELQGSNRQVRVDRAKWINFRYGWNRKTESMEKQEIGSYRQYPLILAWAITIHKSQGKTIEKVHLDLGRGSFAFGQTYVALSRCRDLEGLSLTRPLTRSDVKVDGDSQTFNNHLHDLIEKLPWETMLESIDEQQEPPRYGSGPD